MVKKIINNEKQPQKMYQNIEETRKISKEPNKLIYQNIRGLITENSKAKKRVL